MQIALNLWKWWVNIEMTFSHANYDEISLFLAFYTYLSKKIHSNLEFHTVFSCLPSKANLDILNEEFQCTWNYNSFKALK